jgi:purine-nucleoside phosphorylase
LLWAGDSDILFLLEQAKMKPKDIVTPKPIPGFPAQRVIYVPCDLPSRLLSSALKKQAQSETDLGFGLVYMFKRSLVLFGALGAPAAALALEPMLMSGTKEVILLGFCGSLSGSLVIGDVASVSRAISEEGTSRHYLPRKHVFTPSPELAGHIENSLRASGLGFKTGTIVSTDAPFRETRSWLRKNRKRGAELVDMETSAVFALAEFRGVKAASLQVVVDELSGETWRRGFSNRRVEEQTKACFLPLLFSGSS